MTWQDSAALLEPAPAAGLLPGTARGGLRPNAAFARGAPIGLIAELSTALIDANAQELDAAIERALRSIGQAFELDRTAMTLFSGGTFSVHARWARSDRERPELLENVPLGPFSFTTRILRRGEPLVVSSLDDLPAEADVERRFFAGRGTAAFINMPMRVQREAIGLLTASCVRGPRVWDDEARAVLRLCADLFASAVERKRTHAALARRAFGFDRGSLARFDVASSAGEHEAREHEPGFVGIIGRSSALDEAMAKVRAVSSAQTTVLIHGESGVGKELFARAIHAHSGRRGAPLVKVNCASVPRELFESEFFGHVRGAFTGAHKDRAGRFELADGGTILLDEVGEIPIELQSKLLRVLQEGEFERVGDERTRKVDVRVIAATNRDLLAEVGAGRFRRDLYYRINAFPIVVPPLRERGTDIILLAEHYLKKQARSLGVVAPVLDERQRAELLAYTWPGNVRELEHVLERALILAQNGELCLDLPLVGRASAARPVSQFVRASELKNLERENLLAALHGASWRINGKNGAAEMLGLKPSTLRDRMRTLGIDRPR